MSIEDGRIRSVFERSLQGTRQATNCEVETVNANLQMNHCKRNQHSNLIHLVGKFRFLFIKFV